MKIQLQNGVKYFQAINLHLENGLIIKIYKGLMGICSKKTQITQLKSGESTQINVSKEDNQMANRYTKISVILLISREMLTINQN